jgi:hypothetical protein
MGAYQRHRILYSLDKRSWALRIMFPYHTEITWLYWNGTMRDIRVVAAYRDDSWRLDEDAILQYSKSRGCSRRGLPFPEREEIHKDVVSRIW